MGELRKVRFADRALLRDDRMHAGVQQLRVAARYCGLNSGVAEQQAVQPHRHHGAHLGLGGLRPDAERMAVYQLAVELLKKFFRDLVIFVPADSGVEAVDRDVGVDQVVDEFS